MRTLSCVRAGAAAAVVAALVSAGCASDFTRSSQSPTQLVINQILVARSTGTVPTSFVNGPLLSDVRSDTGTIFDDFGQATIRAIMRDQGSTGVAPTTSVINDVTITRFRVRYLRSDGRNTPGTDVPHAFDGALTLTIPIGSTGVGVFELVRHVAKAEPPLAALVTNQVVVTTIAEVTFFGRDQAGNEVSVTGNVQVNFANFAG